MAVKSYLIVLDGKQLDRRIELPDDQATEGQIVEVRGEQLNGFYKVERVHEESLKKGCVRMHAGRSHFGPYFRTITLEEVPDPALVPA